MYRFTRPLEGVDETLPDDVSSLLSQQLLFPNENRDYDYVLHEYTENGKTEYQISIATEEDNLQFLSFPRTGNMDTISDQPTVTRLFGEMSEDTRSGAWLTYQSETDSGVNHNTGIYKIIDSGKLRIGEQNEKFAEIFFKGSLMSDRWILRTIPNILDKALFSSSSIFVLWKPAKQLSYNNAYSKNKEYKDIKCDCPVKSSSAHFHELAREEGEELRSKLSTDILFDNKNNTFDGVGAAEGTWIDMFGEKYTYTPEFVVHTYNKQRDALAKGEKILVGTEHGVLESFNGEITSVELVKDPIYHIRVKGVYTGPSNIEDEQFGLSYEFRLRSVWNSEFQSWVPYDSITDRIDVVRRPACKICWINKVL